MSRSLERRKRQDNRAQRRARGNDSELTEQLDQLGKRTMAQVEGSSRRGFADMAVLPQQLFSDLESTIGDIDTQPQVRTAVGKLTEVMEAAAQLLPLHLDDIAARNTWVPEDLADNAEVAERRQNDNQTSTNRLQHIARVANTNETHADGGEKRRNPLAKRLAGVMGNRELGAGVTETIANIGLVGFERGAAAATAAIGGSLQELLRAASAALGDRAAPTDPTTAPANDVGVEGELAPQPRGEVAAPTADTKPQDAAAATDRAAREQEEGGEQEAGAEPSPESEPNAAAGASSPISIDGAGLHVALPGAELSLGPNGVRLSSEMGALQLGAAGASASLATSFGNVTVGSQGVSAHLAAQGATFELGARGPAASVQTDLGALRVGADGVSLTTQLGSIQAGPDGVRGHLDGVGAITGAARAAFAPRTPGETSAAASGGVPSSGGQGALDPLATLSASVTTALAPARAAVAQVGGMVRSAVETLGGAAPGAASEGHASAALPASAIGAAPDRQPARDRGDGGELTRDDAGNKVTAGVAARKPVRDDGHAHRAPEAATAAALPTSTPVATAPARPDRAASPHSPASAAAPASRAPAGDAAATTRRAAAAELASNPTAPAQGSPNAAPAVRAPDGTANAPRDALDKAVAAQRFVSRDGRSDVAAEPTALRAGPAPAPAPVRLGPSAPTPLAPVPLTPVARHDGPVTQPDLQISGRGETPPTPKPMAQTGAATPAPQPSSSSPTVGASEVTPAASPARPAPAPLQRVAPAPATPAAASAARADLAQLRVAPVGGAALPATPAALSLDPSSLPSAKARPNVELTAAAIESAPQKDVPAVAVAENQTAAPETPTTQATPPEITTAAPPASGVPEPSQMVQATVSLGKDRDNATLQLDAEQRSQRKLPPAADRQRSTELVPLGPELARQVPTLEAPARQQLTASSTRQTASVTNAGAQGSQSIASDGAQRQASHAERAANHRATVAGQPAPGILAASAPNAVAAAPIAQSQATVAHAATATQPAPALAVPAEAAQIAERASFGPLDQSALAELSAPRPMPQVDVDGAQQAGSAVEQARGQHRATLDLARNLPPPELAVPVRSSNEEDPQAAPPPPEQPGRPQARSRAAAIAEIEAGIARGAKEQAPAQLAAASGQLASEYQGHADTASQQARDELSSAQTQAQAQAAQIESQPPPVTAEQVAAEADQHWAAGQAQAQAHAAATSQQVAAAQSNAATGVATAQATRASQVASAQAAQQADNTAAQAGYQSEHQGAQQAFQHQDAAAQQAMTAQQQAAQVSAQARQAEAQTRSATEQATAQCQHQQQTAQAQAQHQSAVAAEEARGRAEQQRLNEQGNQQVQQRQQELERSTSELNTRGQQQVAQITRDGEQKYQQRIQQGQREADARKAQGESAAAAKRSEAQSQDSGGLIGAALNWVKQRINELMAMAEQILEAARAAVISILNAARDAAMALLDAARKAALDALSSIKQLIQGAIQAAAAAIRSIISAVANLVRQAIAALAAALQTLVAALTAALTALVQALQQAVNAILDALIQAVSLINADLGRALQQATQQYRDAFNTACNQLQQTIQQAGQTLQQNIARAADRAIAAVDQAEQTLQRAVTAVEEQLHQAVESAYQAGVAAINQVFDAAKAKVDELHQRAVAATNRYFDEKKRQLHAVRDFINTAIDKSIEAVKALGELVSVWAKSIADLVPSSFIKTFVDIWNGPWRNAIIIGAATILAVALTVGTGGLGGPVAAVLLASVIGGALAGGATLAGDALARQGTIELAERGEGIYVPGYGPLKLGPDGQPDLSSIPEKERANVLKNMQWSLSNFDQASLRADANGMVQGTGKSHEEIGQMSMDAGAIAFVEGAVSSGLAAVGGLGGNAIAGRVVGKVAVDATAKQVATHAVRQAVVSSIVNVPVNVISAGSTQAVNQGLTTYSETGDWEKAKQAAGNAFMQGVTDPATWGSSILAVPGSAATARISQSAMSPLLRATTETLVETAADRVGSAAFSAPAAYFQARSSGLTHEQALAAAQEKLSEEFSVGNILMSGGMTAGGKGVDATIERIRGGHQSGGLPTIPRDGAAPDVARPVDTAPARPVDTAPARPVDTAPARPVDTAPARPVDTAPARPVDTAPARPVDTAPARPVDTAPARPVDTAPARPVDTAPARPVDTAPARPVDTAPARPVDTAPARPVDTAPARPVDTAPARPVDTAPVRPVDTNTPSPDVGAVKGADVYPTNTRVDKNGDTVPVYLNSEKAQKGLRTLVSSGRTYGPDGTITNLSHRETTNAAGRKVPEASLQLDLPAQGSNPAAKIDVDIKFLPPTELAPTTTHGGDAGPARFSVTQDSSGQWRATVEVDGRVRPEDLQFIVGHELTEIGHIVRDNPSGIPQGGLGPQVNAGVLADGSTSSMPTAHDRAAAHEVASLANDLQRLQAPSSGAKPDTVAHRQATLDAAIEAAGLTKPGNVDAKLRLLTEAGAPQSLIDRVQLAESQRVLDANLPAGSNLSPSAVQHLLYPAHPTGGFSNGISGGHVTSKVKDFGGPGTPYGFVEVATTNAGGTTVRQFDQYKWNGTGEKPLPGSGRYPGEANFDPTAWTRSSQPKTTVDDLGPYLREVDGALSAWYAQNGTAIPNDRKFSQTSPGGVRIEGFFEPTPGPDGKPVVRTAYVDAAWISQQQPAQTAQPPAASQKALSPSSANPTMVPEHAVPRNERAREPNPVTVGDKSYDVMGMTPDGQLVLRPEGVITRNIPTENLTGRTATYGDQPYTIASVDPASGGGVSVRLISVADPSQSIVVSGPAARDIELRFPGGAPMQLGDWAHGVVRLQPAGVVPSTTSPLAPGQTFEARLRGKELDGVYTVRSQDGQLIATGRDRDGNVVEHPISPADIAPRYVDVQSANFDTPHQRSAFEVAEDRVKRTAETTSDGEMPIRDPLLGTLQDQPNSQVLNGVDSLAVQDNFIVDRAAPGEANPTGAGRNLTVFNIVFNNSGEAKRVLDAMVEFRKQNPEATIRLVVANTESRPATDQTRADEAQMRQTMADHDIELVLYAGGLKPTTPQGEDRMVIHAKGVMVDGDVLFTTAGVIDPAVKNKMDVSTELPPQAAQAFRQYFDEAVVGNASVERRQQLAAELAAQGVLVSDPVAQLPYIARANDALIRGAKKDLYINTSELRDLEATQKIIDQVAAGVEVRILARDFDAKALEMLQAAKAQYPDRLTFGQPDTWDPRPHYNVIIADGVQAYVGTAYLWPNQQSNIQHARSFENGVLLQGDRARSLREQLDAHEASATGAAKPKSEAATAPRDTAPAQTEETAAPRAVDETSPQGEHRPLEVPDRPLSNREAVTEQLAHGMVARDLSDADLAFLQQNGYEAGPILRGKREFVMRVFHSTDPAQPTMVSFRGTVPSKVQTLIADADPAGIGIYQWDANRDLIASAMEAASRNGKVVVAGHSLGGALAQITASRFPDKVASITTFQAPGVTKETAQKLRDYNAANPDAAIESTHHRVLGDLVPRGGETLTDGTIHKYTMTGGSWKSNNVLMRHLASPLAQLERALGNRLPTQNLDESIGFVHEGTQGTDTDTVPGGPIETARRLLGTGLFAIGGAYHRLRQLLFGGSAPTSGPDPFIDAMTQAPNVPPGAGSSAAANVRARPDLEEDPWGQSGDLSALRGLVPPEHLREQR